MKITRAEAFTVEQAIAFARRAEDASVSIIPVMADDSLMGLEDAFSLAWRGLFDMLNVKLVKVGGIDEAIQIDGLSSAWRLPVMIGSMDESALSIAAGLNLALARPNVANADVDGRFDLLDDPARGAVLSRNGRLYPAGGNGLGFDLP